MRIVTFYSFKGGVGRSLALVNVGVELAQNGRRVLLVDFDLEAPGLSTFDSLRPSRPCAGVVDFVCDYVASKTSPDVLDYVYESVTVGKNGGQLWVMPAGRSDRAYQGRLAKVDWKSLYAQHDGYLLFEDLKAQWRETLKPDYVLIDSRTGHTDVQGICTRQLPDAVVILFFPNQQNLAGLEGVVHDIRSEAESAQKKDISLHFVMSNVPDLDDEEEILKRKIEEFRSRLRFHGMSALIHRYDSLSLVNQAIFTSERPNSRLAKEYRELTNVLVKENLEDREGAIQFLQDELRRSRGPRRFASPGQFEESCIRITDLHANDGEVLFWLGEVREVKDRKEEALMLYDRALQAPTLPEGLRSTVLLERAALRIRSGDDRAREDLVAVFLSPPSERLDVERAVRLLRATSPKDLGVLINSPIVEQLPFAEKFSVVHELSWSREGLCVSVGLLRNAIKDARLDKDQEQNLRAELALALIGLGRFGEAVELTRQLLAVQPSTINHKFNLAMAQWGYVGTPDRSLFQSVLGMMIDDNSPSPNFEQCLAVAFCVCDQPEEATRRIKMAEELASKRKTIDFSCWRYLLTKPSEFLEDCAAIRRLILGEEVEPEFIRRSSEEKVSEEKVSG